MVRDGAQTAGNEHDKWFTSDRVRLIRLQHAMYEAGRHLVRLGIATSLDSVLDTRDVFRR